MNGVGDHLPEGLRVSLRVFPSVFDVVENRPRFPKKASIFRVDDVEFAVILKVLKSDLLINPFSCLQNLASKETVLFVDFNNFLNIDLQIKIKLLLTIQRRRDGKSVITDRPNKSFALGLVGFVRAVGFPVASVGHVDRGGR